MSILKTLAIALAIILLAVAGVAVYLVSTFDTARIEHEITAAVERQTGRTLHFEGGLVLSFWPDLVVSLGRSSLSEPGGTGEFARLENARVIVALMPLFSQELRVRSMEINGLIVHLVKRKDGTLNMADLLKGLSKTGSQDTTANLPPGSEKTPVPPPSTFFIDHFHLTDARLNWRDEQAARSFSLENLNLHAKAIRFGPEASAFGIEKIGLDARAQIAAARMRLDLASPLAIDAAQRSVLLSGLAGQIEIAHPRLLVESLTLPFSGEARILLARRSAMLDLDARLDESRIQARFDINHFAPPALNFALDIDKLDVHRYLPRRKPGEKPLDLSAMRSLDVSGTARIGELRIANVRTNNVRLRIEAKD